jgi:hypothetical protein
MIMRANCFNLCEAAWLREKVIQDKQMLIRQMWRRREGPSMDEIGFVSNSQTILVTDQVTDRRSRSRRSHLRDRRA